MFVYSKLIKKIDSTNFYKPYTILINKNPTQKYI